MNAISCLFIGGAKDGQWMAVEEFRKEIYVPVRMSEIPHMRVGEMPMAVNLQMKTEVYKAERLAADKAIFTIYVLEGMTGDEVMAALINGYKKNG